MLINRLIILLILSFSTFSFSKNGNWSTHPNSLKPTKLHKKTANPAIEIPTDFTQKWKLSSTINGQKTGENNGAPAYNFNRISGWSFIGFVPEGTPIELEHAIGKARIHYYSMEKPANFIARESGLKKAKPSKQKKNQKPVQIWIPGSYIIPQ